MTIRPSPLSPERVVHMMPSGMTIAAMLQSYPEPIPELFYDERYGVLEINGDRIPQAYWSRVTLRRDSAAPVVITMYFKPADGGSGGGGKNTALLLGSIALIAATGFIGAGGIAAVGLFGAAATGTFAAGGLGAVLGSAGLGIAGSLALGALASTAAAARPRVGGGGSLREVIAGITANPLRPLETIPRVLGQVRVSPPHLISAYSKMVGNRVAIYACVGLAGKIDLTNIRINGMDEANFETVTTASSEIGAALTLATDNCIEQIPNERLSKHDVKQDDDAGRELVDQTTPANSLPKFHYYRTSGIPTKVRIRLFWPMGHSYTNSTGNRRIAETWIRIEVRRVGDVTWIRLPTLVYGGEFNTERRSQITLSWGTANAASVTVGGGQNFHAGASSTTGLGQTYEYDSNAIYKFAADPNTAAKNIERDGEQGWIIHMPLATFPQTAEYEVRIKRSSTRLESAVTGVATDDLFGFETEAGIDKIFGSDDNADQNRAACEIIVESFATVRSGVPLTPTDLSYVEIEAFELRVETISVLATSKANNWSGSAWGTTGNTNTQNPASLFRHVLLDATLNGEPLDPALLDDSVSGSLVDWYNYCNSNALECNVVIQGQSVEEVLQIICAAGHAGLRRSDTWGVIIERDRTAQAITQIFSTHNAWGHSLKKIFPDPPLDGLYVTYLNELDDFTPAERLVTYSAGDNIEAVEFPGVTLAARVDEVANLALRQRALRNNFYSFSTDIQGLVSQRGDLVGYEYDVIDEFRFSAWVTEAIVTPAGTCTGVILDSAVDIAALIGDIFSALDVFALADVFAGSQSLGIVIRQNDGTITARNVDTTNIGAGATRLINFTSPISIGGDATLINGALAVVGILNTETRRCIVFDIEWEPDLTARVTLVDEAPEIHPL